MRTLNVVHVADSTYTFVPAVVECGQCPYHESSNTDAGAAILRDQHERETGHASVKITNRTKER